ncbi:hypothetical protein Syun_018173 [Stephania yunnanensis]|uniref:Uncharacterized protein n=1 Tax=Stephania yunnanensis TaxID=152371 RepID=A0AAP0IU10_9MAGN
MRCRCREDLMDERRKSSVFAVIKAEAENIRCRIRYTRHVDWNAVHAMQTCSSLCSASSTQKRLMCAVGCGSYHGQCEIGCMLEENLVLGRDLNR